MTKLKALLLMAIITLGVAGAAKAARGGCCGSELCCASCAGCK